MDKYYLFKFNIQNGSDSYDHFKLTSINIPEDTTISQIVNIIENKGTELARKNYTDGIDQGYDIYYSEDNGQSIQYDGDLELTKQEYDKLLNFI